MENRIATVSGSVTWHTAAIWDGGTLPSAGDNLNYTGSGTITQGQNDTTVYGTETCEAGVTVAHGVYEFHCTDSTIAGSQTMGVSAGVGKVVTSWTVNTGATGSFDNLSKVTNSGNLTWPNENWAGSNSKITYRQVGNGTITQVSAFMQIYSCTVDGCTLTCANGNATRITNTGSKEFILANGGVLALGNNSCYVGMSSSAGSNITIGSGCDITGVAGSVLRWNTLGTNFVNNRTTKFSIAQKISQNANAATGFTFPAWDFSDADCEIYGPNTTAGGTRIICAGHLKCKSLSFASADTTGKDFIVDCVTYNPDITVNGAIAYKGDAKTWTLTYLRGTGKHYLTDGAANIDYNGATVEEIVCEQTAAKSIVSNFTTKKVSGTIAGTGSLISSVAGTQRVITCQEKGEHLGTLGIRDISFGAKGIAGGKSCRNLGNVKGFVFADTSLIQASM